jgi:hypothetical protein
VSAARERPAIFILAVTQVPPLPLSRPVPFSQCPPGSSRALPERFRRRSPPARLPLRRANFSRRPLRQRGWNALLPSTVAPGVAQVTVTNATGTSASYPIAVNALQPGLLATPAFVIGGRQYVAALFPEGVPSRSLSERFQACSRNRQNAHFQCRWCMTAWRPVIRGSINSM